ncbi:MAG: YitT family protein, partial [Ruminococcus bromii]
GAYSGNDKKVIMCAVRPQEVYKITSGIKNVDPNAFIIVTTAGAIKGRGFVNIDSN